jgi:tRNA-splicing ligase RtcB
MFVIYDKEKQKVPIKIWLKNKEDIEEGALEQALNLSNLPFLHKWVALMPDTHQGYGMPIGGVICTKDVIIPNAVGVDIGCGMGFIETNIPVKLLKDTETVNGNLVKMIVGQIMRDVPVGFTKHKNNQENKRVCLIMNDVLDDFMIEEIKNMQYQIGTLGGGNHFIELQEDEDGMLGIMLHSGSRHFGYTVAKYFNELAKELNKKWYSSVPENYELAFLPLKSEEGKGYIKYMQLAMEYAEENRKVMMEIIKEKVEKYVEKYTDISVDFALEVNAHHNYACIENHYGKNIWVHRKGAIRARKGDIGIIPGAMGSYSYIVDGLGNPESFCSCSHGAGRKMSRTKALEKYTTQEVIKDLKEKDVVLGKASKEKVADESRWAYKNIDEVIENEKDLVKPIKKLKTVAVIKG